MNTPTSSTPSPAGGTADWLRRVGCITTSRADAGIYHPLLAALTAEPAWEVMCLAGGTHLSSDFGHTIEAFSDMPQLTTVPVDHLIPGDGPVEVATTAGRAVEQYSHALAVDRPDLVFVLGDRTEMLAATLAALIHAIPIAHLHGGDVTEGAYDNQCRHAISKLSHVHFAALPEHAERITGMGEESWRVHIVGGLALDVLRNFKPSSVSELSTAVGLDFSRPTVVVVFHPETLHPWPAARQVDELLLGLHALDANLLLIGPNADVGHHAIREALQRFAASRENACLVSSLSQHRYWSCLTHAAVLVGNSSSGIIEAAGFSLPVVNVGDRQTGRLRPANVLDAAMDRGEIAAALHTAVEPAFREGLRGLANPYGDGHAADRIIAALHILPDREKLLHKRWPTRPA
ncbi:MAG: UDP-N-acetylglucosamine 2-epimerase [Planctomycetota bacterium]